MLVNINNHKHYVIIKAKFHSSTINNAHTMSPANMSAALQKLYGWQHSFLNSKCLFVQHLCWPLASQPGVSAHGVH